jgi:hypothetical protein
MKNPIFCQSVRLRVYRSGFANENRFNRLRTLAAKASGEN